jgi:DNA-binding response OmpR family regulator
MLLANTDPTKRTHATERADGCRAGADADAGVHAIFAPRLCLIDPNPVTRALLMEALHDKGFDIVAAVDMVTLPPAVEALVLVLDGMPQKAKRPSWLAQEPSVPVIVLDRPHALSGLVAPLGFTPDARLEMPVQPRKLMVTIRQVLSRARIDPVEARATTAHAFHFRGWTLHVGERRLESRDGESVLLGKQECEALRALLSFPRQLLTRKQLIAVIWGTDRAIPSRMLDDPIKRLRRHLGEDVRFPRLIKTVVGVGYRFDADVESAG